MLPTKRDSIKTFSMLYNFGTNGGAQGVYDSFFLLPYGAVPLTVGIAVNKQPTSGANLAVLDVGIGSNESMFISSLSITSLPDASVFNFTWPLMGWGIVPNLAGEPFTLKINLEDLTDGVFTLYMLYLEF